MSISSVLGCPFGIELAGCFVYVFFNDNDEVPYWNQLYFEGHWVGWSWLVTFFDGFWKM